MTSRVVSRNMLALVPALALVAACSHSAGSGRDPEPRRAASGSSNGAASVSSGDVERSAAGGQPVEKALSGRISGVTVMDTPDGIAVRIRGTSSFNGNNDPLYVVDGTPVAPNSNGALVGISPSDIASIRVLKDPADLTMWGARGANGVIEIKTKRAARRQ